MFRKHRKITAYMLALLMFTTYVMLDTFAITRVYGDAAEAAGTESAQDADSSQGSMADQLESDASDSDSGNMHSGGSGGQSGRGPGSGSGSNHGPGSGKGPGGHSGKGPGKHNESSDTTSDPSSSGSSADTSKSSSSSSAADASDTANDAADTSASNAKTAGNAVSTSTSYSDDNMSITLKEYRVNDTTIYVADVELTSSSYLKTALAQGSYGRNVTAKTSEIAQSVNAVLAVNGDYYGAQEKGYVIRNGVLYRDTAISNQEDLVIYRDGSFGIINESEVTAQELMDNGAVQTLSFGPALVQNGSIAVSENEEVGQAMASNPRTAIGMIDENHYIFVVSDGRTDESEGLSLSELAEFMDALGASTAYNLDGGGSSTMYFNGSVVNNTTGGMGSSERSVSDIVYIG